MQHFEQPLGGLLGASRGGLIIRLPTNLSHTRFLFQFVWAMGILKSTSLEVPCALFFLLTYIRL